MQDFKILVVDDEPDIRETTAMVLRMSMEDVVVDIARDGAEAWEKIQSNHYDLVITDLTMPNMDGLDLTKHIREEGRVKGLPVIMISGRFEEYQDRAQQAGVSTLIKKPAGLNDVLNAIHSLFPSDPAPEQHYSPGGP